MSLSKSPSETDSDEESSSTTAETYERLESILNEMGEVMVESAAGETLELHKHNVEFEDEPWFRVDADDETHWVDAESIQHYWIHEEI